MAGRGFFETNAVRKAEERLKLYKYCIRISIREAMLDVSEAYCHQILKSDFCDGQGSSHNISLLNCSYNRAGVYGNSRVDAFLVTKTRTNSKAG